MQTNEEVPENSRTNPNPKKPPILLLSSFPAHPFSILPTSHPFSRLNSGSKSDYSIIFYLPIIFVDIVDQAMSFFSQFGGGFPFGGFGGHDEDDCTYLPNSASSG